MRSIRRQPNPSSQRNRPRYVSAIQQPIYHPRGCFTAARRTEIQASGQLLPLRGPLNHSQTEPAVTITPPDSTTGGLSARAVFMIPLRGCDCQRGLPAAAAAVAPRDTDAKCRADVYEVYSTQAAPGGTRLPYCNVQRAAPRRAAPRSLHYCQ